MLAVHPNNPNAVVVAGLTSFARTTDGCATADGWTNVPSPGAVGTAYMTAVTIDSAGDVYAAFTNGKLYRYSGSSWTSWGPTASSGLVAAIAVKSGVSWVGSASGLYRNTGGGWTLVLGGSGYAVSDIEVDPHCPTRVYAGMGFLFDRLQHRGGVYVSTSSGAPGTWTSLSMGVPGVHNVPVTDIQVDLANVRKFYVSTYGRGFWLYDYAGSPSCP